MHLLIKHLGYLLLFCGFLPNKSQGQPTSAAIVGWYQINKRQPTAINSKVKEQARRNAIAHTKLKNGCVKPDSKKIAAAKAAEKKYKKPEKQQVGLTGKQAKQMQKK